MKKILLFAACTALLSASGSKIKYVIEGNLAGLSGTVYLFDEEQNVVDSAAVDNGAFHFKGTAESPAMYMLSDAKDLPGTFYARFILEPGTIAISDGAENPMLKTATGTPANDACAAYTEASYKLITEYRDESTSEERRTAIEEEYDNLARQAIEQNRSNLFGATMLAGQSYELSGQETLDEIAKFPPEMQQNKVLANLRKQAEAKLRTDVGQPFTDVTAPDAEGNDISLKSVVGNPANKYVLLDFWASWCGPCMGEVPHLVKTYKEFHKKGFEIFGVSFDDDRGKWLDAVKENKMEWIHVSELNSWDNQAREDYAVQGIPANFLIDSDGKIIARDLRGEELYAKIAELLK